MLAVEGRQEARKALPIISTRLYIPDRVVASICAPGNMSKILYIVFTPEPASNPRLYSQYKHICCAESLCYNVQKLPLEMLSGLQQALGFHLHILPSHGWAL